MWRSSIAWSFALVTSGRSRCWAIWGYHQLEYQNRDIGELVETLVSLYGVKGVIGNGES
jgi:hypothetical protein